MKMLSSDNEKSLSSCLFLIIDAIEKANTDDRRFLSNGDVASLRRMTMDNLPAAFWSLKNRLPESYAFKNREQRWYLIFKSMAIMAPHVHDKTVNLGKSLCLAGYMEQRLSRLLDAKGESFDDFIISAFRFLASKAQPVNWFNAVYFILNPQTDGRTSVARDFFSTLYKQAKEEQKE
jgi:CRISPR-associated protein Cse2 (CRISPR_cse2)